MSLSRWVLLLWALPPPRSRWAPVEVRLLATALGVGGPAMEEGFSRLAGGGIVGGGLSHEEVEVLQSAEARLLVD